MSGFSPEWLALREPADHRSRCAALAERLRSVFADRTSIEVVDIGCGTGSNLRATSGLLPGAQHWTLVDYDPALLSAARTTLTAWAEHAEARDGGIRLVKEGRHIDVAFRRADLSADLDGALKGKGGAGPDLVTASAFFDLCSPAFMARFAAAVSRLGAAFYTVLTYNGEQAWTPADPADAEMAAAFHRHQRSDKGFGAAAGPDSARALAAAFRDAGYEVKEGDSPWVLGPGEERLVADLAAGFASAATETGLVGPDTISAWTAVRRTGARVGHTDTFALPSKV